MGMANLAHLGIEDFMNDTFAQYSSTLFNFEELRAEMDYIRAVSYTHLMPGRSSWCWSRNTAASSAGT